MGKIRGKLCYSWPTSMDNQENSASFSVQNRVLKSLKWPNNDQHGHFYQLSVHRSRNFTDFSLCIYDHCLLKAFYIFIHNLDSVQIRYCVEKVSTESKQFLILLSTVCEKKYYYDDIRIKSEINWTSSKTFIHNVIYTTSHLYYNKLFDLHYSICVSKEGIFRYFWFLFSLFFWNKIVNDRGVTKAEKIHER